MNHIFIRLNGRGNAWPVFVGETHPFYSHENPDDLGNVSYSFIGSNKPDPDIGKIEWELLVDAGFNTVSYIIRHENRIPEAIILTHPHLDHTVGIDWIAESFVYGHQFKRKYPIYATLPCWEYVKQSFPQLTGIIEFNELVPGIQCKIKEVSDMHVTAFPVYHGNSGFGASLLLFEFQNQANMGVKAVITGDMLTPLITNQDLQRITGSKVIYIDCNNRFPFPESNHGSFVSYDPDSGTISPFLTKWLEQLTFSKLMAPHVQNPCNAEIYNYFDRLIKDLNEPGLLTFTITDLLKRIQIPEVNLVHYSGFEDRKKYNQKALNDSELESWANNIITSENTKSRIRVPRTGDHFKLV